MTLATKRPFNMHQVNPFASAYHLADDVDILLPREAKISRLKLY
jgi:hypothetical protein